MLIYIRYATRRRRDVNRRSDITVYVSNTIPCGVTPYLVIIRDPESSYRISCNFTRARTRASERYTYSMYIYIYTFRHETDAGTRLVSIKIIWDQCKFQTTYSIPH